ncbi:MAG: lamin tail domain-containing protein [Chloroflexi bacterium]|nr:lamin tail domain-containing protein [Chloroflexota bacterium]
MRPDKGLIRATLVAAVALLSSVAAPSSAQSENVLSNGGFEDGASGWLTSGTNATLTVDETDPVHSGSAAGRLTATAAGAISTASQYWWAPIDALKQYTLSIELQADDPGISNVAATLEVVDGDGEVLASREGSPETGSGWLSITTEPVDAPASAEYARIVVSAAAASAGAVLHIDSAAVTVADPEPQPTETATTTATATATPTGTATATAPPPPPPEPTVTVPPVDVPKPTLRSVTKRPEPRPTFPARLIAEPPPRRVAPLLLRNGDFESPDGFDGWHARGGEVRVEESTPGSSVAVLTSRTTATKWIYQVVPVTLGEWYQAGAWLQPRDDAELGLVRIAWYASSDGSGRQLATVDSSPAPGDAADLVEVTTGAVQAPPTARSAQVRLMLRPRSSALASLIADDAYFEPTSAPAPEPPEAPPPTETPVASPTAIAAPSPAATPSPEAIASPVSSAAPATATPAASPEPTARPSRNTPPEPVASPTPESTPPSAPQVVRSVALAPALPPTRPAATISATAPVLTAFDIPLRITALLPDPIEPGPDARFEWIEVTNVGRSPLRIRGFELRDNAASLALPDIELPAGGSIIVAGESADVGDVIALRVAGGLFNGLANAGDRVVLLTTAGAVVDSLSYGDDRSSFGPPLAAPGAGEQLRRRFAANGTLIAVEVGSRTADGARLAAAPVASTPGTEMPTVGVQTSARVAASGPASGSATGAAARPELTPTEPSLEPEAARSGEEVNRSAWIALASIALGALAGVGAFRLRELLAV